MVQLGEGIEYFRAEVETHNSESSLWVIIHDKVYDITKFLDQHPGGIEVIQDFAGQDATNAFEDLNHSPEARSILQEHYLGDLREEDQKKIVKGVNSDIWQTIPTWTTIIGPIFTVLGICFYLRYLGILGD